MAVIQYLAIILTMLARCTTLVSTNLPASCANEHVDYPSLTLECLYCRVTTVTFAVLAVQVLDAPGIRAAGLIRSTEHGDEPCDQYLRVMCAGKISTIIDDEIEIIGASSEVRPSRVQHGEAGPRRSSSATTNV